MCKSLWFWPSESTLAYLRREPQHRAYRAKVRDILARARAESKGRRWPGWRSCILCGRWIASSNQADICTREGCEGAHASALYKKNREASQAYHREHYVANRERYARWAKEYRIRNREKLGIKRKADYWANREVERAKDTMRARLAGRLPRRRGEDHPNWQGGKHCYCKTCGRYSKYRAPNALARWKGQCRKCALVEYRRVGAVNRSLKKQRQEDRKQDRKLRVAERHRIALDECHEWRKSQRDRSARLCRNCGGPIRCGSQYGVCKTNPECWKLWKSLTNLTYNKRRRDHERKAS